MRDFIIGAIASLVASIILILIAYYFKNMRTLLINLLGKLVRIDIDRVYSNAKEAQSDIMKTIEKAKTIKMLMGRGNELQTETYNHLLQLPKKYASVQILLPKTIINESEFDWVRARENEIIEFDNAFTDNILREQINVTIKFLQNTVKNNPNFELRFFNAPHIGKIVITDQYLFYYMMEKNSHGRECTMYRCKLNSNTYNSFLRLFDILWTNSSKTNAK